MTTNLQDYLELLTAEQHVQVDKLRESARNGVPPRVRGEVWMYLLTVLQADKTSEMTSLKSLRTTYAELPSSLPTDLASMLLHTALAHHTRRFESPTYDTLISTLTAEHGPANPARAHQSRVGPSPNLAATARDIPPPLALEDSFRGKGFLVPPPTGPPSRHAYLSIMEEVLGKYYHAAKIQEGEEKEGWSPGPPPPEDWVYLATPFVCCLSRPIAVFYAFEKLTERMSTFPSLPDRLGSMLGLFRLAVPELHAYFEDEQVPMVSVAISWMTTLLAREMWLGDVLRLWDTYFAAEDMFALHCYVCVAILLTCKETLEELDGSEAKLMLLDLPPLDVDRLLQDAMNLKVQFTLPRPVRDDEE